MGSSSIIVWTWPILFARECIWRSSTDSNFEFGCETSYRVEDGGDFEFWVEDILDAIFAKVEIVGCGSPLVGPTFCVSNCMQIFALMCLGTCGAYGGLKVKG